MNMQTFQFTVVRWTGVSENMDGSQRSEEFLFSLLLFFISSVVSVLERFTNVSYIFFLLNMTL